MKKGLITEKIHDSDSVQEYFVFNDLELPKLFHRVSVFCHQQSLLRGELKIDHIQFEVDEDETDGTKEYSLSLYCDYEHVPLSKVRKLLQKKD